MTEDQPPQIWKHGFRPGIDEIEDPPPLRLFRDFSPIQHPPLMRPGDKVTVTTPHGTWEGFIMPDGGITGQEAEEGVERLAVSLRAFGEQTGRPRCVEEFGPGLGIEYRCTFPADHDYVRHVDQFGNTWRTTPPPGVERVTGL